jgi:DNA polymerase III subunit gamma/tau
VRRVAREARVAPSRAAAVSSAPSPTGPASIGNTALAEWPEEETGGPPKSNPASRPAASHVPPVPRSASQQVAQAAADAQTAALAPSTRPDARVGSAARVAPAPGLAIVRERWPAVADAVRQAGRGMVAQAVQRMTPAEVNPQGRVVLSYAATDDTFAKAIESARADVLAAMQGCIEGVTAFTLRADGPHAADGPPRPMKRLTQQEVTKQRTEQFMSRDPLLDAAVKALDLELLD